MKTRPSPERITNGVHYKNLYIADASGDQKFTSTQMPESDYLQMHVWKKISLAKLNMDHFKCTYCGGLATAVHHLRYPDVWGTELYEDLVSVCPMCHAKLHNRKGE